MRRKTFPFKTILKINMFREKVELYSYLETCKQDRLLAAEYSNFQLKQKKTYELLDKEEYDLGDLRYMHSLIAFFETQKKIIRNEREKIKDKVEKAKNTYNNARKNVKKIEILKDKHKKNEYSLQKRKENEILQERIIWQKRI